MNDGVLTIDVPAPATLDARFDAGTATAEQLPFESADVSAMWKIPGGGGSYLSIVEYTGTTPRPELRVADLTAGEYRVQVRTKPKPSTQNLTGSQEPPINPGAFVASKNVSLASGNVGRIDFQYTPFDSDAFRGDRTAVLRILQTDGSPAAGRQIAVTYFDGHYGSISVFAGPVPESGELTFNGLTARRPEGLANGPYTVTVDKQRLGAFRLCRWLSSSTAHFPLATGRGRSRSRNRAG